MRHWTRRSARNESVTSTKSAKGEDGNDSAANSRPSSSVHDSPRSSLTYASEALANLKNTMGISRAPTPAADAPSSSTKPLPSPPAATATATPSATATAATTTTPTSLPKSASTNTANVGSSGISRSMSTIRTVTSSDDQSHSAPIHAQYTWQAQQAAAAAAAAAATTNDEGSSVGSPSVARTSNSAFSSSVNSNGSTASSQPHSPLRTSSTTANTTSTSESLSKSPNGRVPSGGATSTNLDIPRSGSLRLQHSTSFSKLRSAAAQFEGSSVDTADGGQGDPNFDSTVGKAGLGKTGRVINRLVADNDTLKRDLKLERLKADEARQSARMLEEKMERLVSDYESRLLEASVTKTLLARKERQVESLQAAVELEKKRTAEALERERGWREETEGLRKETKRHVEDASTRAQLMEGRYNALSSHWREEGARVDKKAAALRAEIDELVAQRRDDDHKIGKLRELCEQQDSNIKVLYAQREAIGQQFAAYKAEQEKFLADIKTNAAQREAEQAATLAEAHAVLDKLKWALNVKSTIEWAE